MQTSEQINELAKALAKAQGEVTNAIKNSANLHFKSRYADLAALLDVIRGPMSSNGLSVLQTFDVQFLDKGGAIVFTKTRLMHESGQFISDEFAMKVAKDDPHAIGSACTYGRRYTLAPLFGVAGEDDDGNAASGKTGAPEIATISAKQQTEIRAMLTKIGKDEAAFAAHMGVQSIAEIPAISFNNAIAILKRAEDKAKSAAQKLAEQPSNTENVDAPSPPPAGE